MPSTIIQVDFYITFYIQNRDCLKSYNNKYNLIGVVLVSFGDTFIGLIDDNVGLVRVDYDRVFVHLDWIEQYLDNPDGV